MREIKFRMWNPEGNNMLYDFSNVYECLLQQLAYDNVKDFKVIIPYNHKEHGCEWNQFTGCKDNQDIDVYENDIVEYSFEYDYEKQKAKTYIGRVIWDIDNCGFVIMPQRLVFNSGDFIRVKVIGNFYHNKELLTIN
jgi:hypothetical protein